MQFDDVSYIDGPAIVQFGGTSFYTKDSIKVATMRETWEVATALAGKIDERVKSIATEITFTPCGEVESAASYWPYGVGSIGSSIFGTADVPLVIHSLAGVKLTYGRAGMEQMPSLKLAATATMHGQCKFLAIGKANVDPLTADARVKVEAAALADANFDESKILSPGYTAAFGEAPYAAMESVDGFTIEPQIRVSRRYVDRHGLKKATITGLEVQARFIPVGLTEAQLLTLCAMDGASALVPGQSISKANKDLVISGTGFSFTVHKAGIKSDALEFGDAPRLGELVFGARRTWTAGVANPLWTIAIA